MDWYNYVTSVAKINYVVKCLSILSLSQVFGSALIVVATVLRCKFNKWKNMFENLITFERFWNSKGLPEPTYTDLSNIRFIVIVHLMKTVRRVSLLYLGGGVYHVELLKLVLDTYYLLGTAALVTVMSKVTRNYRRLNKSVQHCLPHCQEPACDPMENRQIIGKTNNTLILI